MKAGGEGNNRGRDGVGWHHHLNGHKFEQTLGGGEGQGNLACCSPWDHKDSDTTEQLDNNNIYREVELLGQRVTLFIISGITFNGKVLFSLLSLIIFIVLST